MTTSRFAHKAAVTLIDCLLKSGWATREAGERWWDMLDRFDRVPSILWRLCERVKSVGLALEALADTMAPRLGVDMYDEVLQPIMEYIYSA